MKRNISQNFAYVKIHTEFKLSHSDSNLFCSSATAQLPIDTIAFVCQS